MDFTVTLVSGTEAFSLVDDKRFIHRWETLAAMDEKVTLLQEPAFVKSWYGQYATVHEPLLCIGKTGDGEIVGLMPLARHLESGAIAHAGTRQATYHGWVAHPEIDESFPVECLISLKGRYPLDSWHWRCMPPGSPSKWLRSERLASTGIFVRQSKVPVALYDFTDTDKIDKIFHHKALRSKINRYKKQGDLFAERIRDKDRTRELIGTLAKQCDFRQEAVHRSRPFAQDPNKANFFVARQDFPDSNYFVVLWANGKPVAFQYAVCDGSRSILNLISNDPSESRQSPGTLLLAHLVRMLRDDGYRIFDLTPGDEYKDRFGNSLCEVIDAEFFFSRKAMVRSVISHAPKDLAKLVLQRLDLLAPARRIVRKLKSNAMTALRGFASKVSASFRKETFHHLRRLDDVFPDHGGTPVECVDIQKFEHLMLYEGSAPFRSRRSVLSDALNRFSAGETLYSVALKGALVHFAWSAQVPRASFPGTAAVSGPSSQVAFLHGFYSNPACSTRQVTELMCRMLRDAGARGGREAVVQFDGSSDIIRDAAKGSGFAVSRTFRQRRLAGY